jgi:transcriptional regulator with XRE-family HTH domain
MAFYDHLKHLRKRKGFTIREVADRSGVSAAYISQLENGNRGIPSPEILMKLSEGLNSSYAELMSIAGYLETDPPKPVQPKQPLNLRRLLRDNPLIFDGKVLSDEDKEWVERMLSVLFWKEKNDSQL